MQTINQNKRTITINRGKIKKTCISRSPKDSYNFAMELAQKLVGGEIITLSGDLGAGKTTFCQGLAKGLGIKKNVTSPTFVLMKIYSIPKTYNLKSSTSTEKLCHIDAYRLVNLQELLDIGADEYLVDKKTITVIEWPEKLVGLDKIVKDIITVKIK